MNFCSGRSYLLIFIFSFLACAASAQQDISRYEDFELNESELYWRFIYTYSGSADSLRKAVSQLLRNKTFTQNVIRTETGYTGELSHYRVNCKRYGRKYTNTLRMYWEGNWKGKFKVEVKEGRYRVTIYGLYYEINTPPDYKHTPQGPMKGKYIDVLCGKDYTCFRKSELGHMPLMNIALKDEFDIKNLKAASADDW